MFKMTPKKQEHSEDELLNKAIAGDRVSLNYLVTRYKDIAYTLAYRIARNREDAEEVVQDSFMKAFKSLASFKKASKFSTWLTRIVVNQCLMRLRQARRARFLYIDEAADEDTLTLELPADQPTPEAMVAETEFGAVLHQEVNRIPAMLRNVFLLRDMQELPMPDVASKLGISVAAAKSRLLRARMELRNRLKKHQGTAGISTLLA